VLPYGPKAAQHFGSIRRALAKQGQPIGINDLHIAAHARSEGLALVPNNLREFESVEALQLANLTPAPPHSTPCTLPSKPYNPRSKYEHCHRSQGNEISFY